MPKKGVKIRVREFQGPRIKLIKEVVGTFGRASVPQRLENQSQMDFSCKVWILCGLLRISELYDEGN